MQISYEKLKKLLVQPGHIPEELFEALAVRASKEDNPLADFLVEQGEIRDDQLGKLIAEDMNIPFARLKDEKIEKDVLRLIAEPVARSKMIVAFHKEAGRLKLGMADPADHEARRAIGKSLDLEIDPYFITGADFSEAMQLYNASPDEEFSQLLSRFEQGLDPRGRDDLVVRLTGLILDSGYANKASDIHIEPEENGALVRFRIDGVMHAVYELPKKLLPLIIARIKVISRLRTDEHKSAQDGKFRHISSGESFDIRVSILPAKGGENAVMRILSSNARKMSLETIGLSPHSLERVESAFRSPHGMILVTGPTGSGKTTTIYEILKILNRPEINIATIEDPVEYDIEGITQIQVDSKTNLTFAKGLRAIVRQDPDIILVGEIRDPETADIAVNSAMTGHLVLSTLHANDSATAIVRLIDMGIEPFLTASTIKVVISQRLVRTICEKCRYSYDLKDEASLLKAFPQATEAISKLSRRKDISKIRIFKGTGCGACVQTGYKGRSGIFEVFETNDRIRELIASKATSGELSAVAREKGMTDLFEDGIDKVLKGVTTLDEVLRVSR